MKKSLLIGIGIITLLVIAFLRQTAIDPDDYTGEWYSASGQRIYRFQEGLIYCEKHMASLSDGNGISGAYTFSGKSIALFAFDVDGLENVKELYLIENKDEAILSDRKDGSGQIYFVRDNRKK